MLQGNEVIRGGGYYQVSSILIIIVEFDEDMIDRSSDNCCTAPHHKSRYLQVNEELPTPPRWSRLFEVLNPNAKEKSDQKPLP